MHIGFVELCTAVTADGNISSQATEVKMAMHIGFVELCTTVTADGDFSNQATEVKMTVQDLYKYMLQEIVESSKHITLNFSWP